MAPTVAAYLAHVRPLRQRAQIWRLGLAVMVVMLGQAVMTYILFSIFDDLVWLDTPFSQMLLFYTFSGWILGTILVMRAVHRQSEELLMGLNSGFDWRQFLRASVIFLILGMFVFLVSSVYGFYGPNVPAERWYSYILPTTAAIFIQVFAEEFFFRGYLQSQLASRYRSPWVWIGVPSVLFGVLHAGTAIGFGANTLLFLAVPTLLGVLAAHLTVRTGNIAAATGLHFANNMIAVLLVSFPEPIGLLSLFSYTFEHTDQATVRTMLLVNIGVMLITYAIFLFLTPPHTRQSKIASAPAQD